MFNTTRFQLLGSPDKVGFETGFKLTTELPLSNADANSPTAILKRGKIVDEKANDETLMKLGTGFGIGILTRDISLNGTTDDAGFKKLTLGGYPDIPVKRGQPVTIFCPFPGCEAIFEGDADVSGGDGPGIDELVVKTGSAGSPAISAATPVGTQLTVVNGAWCVCLTGRWVLAHLMQSNYTPVNAGEIRIRVRFCSPYKI